MKNKELCLHYIGNKQCRYKNAFCSYNKQGICKISGGLKKHGYKYKEYRQPTKTKFTGYSYFPSSIKISVK